MELTDILIHFSVSTQVQFHCTHKFARIGAESNIYTEKFRFLIDLSKAQIEACILRATAKSEKHWSARPTLLKREYIAQIKKKKKKLEYGLFDPLVSFRICNIPIRRRYTFLKI